MFHKLPSLALVLTSMTVLPRVECRTIMSWPRRILPILALLLPLAACQRSRPNVLIITIDTLRADHLGSYGFTLARTPVLDSLATEGVRCTDAISTAPITMPAHTTIFTGL